MSRIIGFLFWTLLVPSPFSRTFGVGQKISYRFHTEIIITTVHNIQKKSSSQESPLTDSARLAVCVPVWASVSIISQDQSDNNQNNTPIQKIIAKTKVVNIASWINSLHKLLLEHGASLFPCSSWSSIPVIKYQRVVHSTSTKITFTTAQTIVNKKK